MTHNVPTSIGLSDQSRTAMVRELKAILGSEYVLAVRTQNFHWNVVGLSFKPFHLFYEEQYNTLLEIIDEVAERIRALGEFSPGTLTEFLQDSILKESPGTLPDEHGMAAQLLKDHEAVIVRVRAAEKVSQDVHDAGTTNFLGELLEKHEKMAWMLRATVTR